jgi:hypothetical protein
MAARFRTIIPKLLPEKVFTDAFEKASRAMEKDVKGAFDDRVKDWKKKPVFRGYVRLGSPGTLISVTTQDEIFKFVDEGTKPHIIKPKGPGYPLHWVNKTGGDVFAKLVHHPGYKGAKFTKEIIEIWTDLMPDYFDKYLVKAIQESGHALK